MKNKSILAATLLLIAFACDNEKDNVIPEKTSLLTLTVDASYPTDVADHWIIVHGEDGSLLASESFETAQELEVVTEKPVTGKITVTHLRYFVQNNNKFYYATSHSNIEKGKHMILKLLTGTPPAETGKLSVSVSNVASLDHRSLSSQISSSGGSSWSGGTGILDMESTTFNGISKHIITVSDGYSLKYKTLTEVKPDESYSFSFYDMAPFDQTVDFTFPQTYDVMLNVWGSEPGVTLTPNYYALIAHYNLDAHTTIKAGYLNSLTNYRTQLNISYSDYGYEYLNIGSIPDGNIAWPQKSDFNINEKSFTNFSASSSKSYVWRLSRWSYSDAASQTVIAWDVSASSGNQSIRELPSEITSVHPALSFDKLKHASTSFYTQSPAFESIIKDDFEPGPESDGLRLGIRIITN